MEKRIFFVDDEKPILEMLSNAFNTFGYEVTTAGSGEEALQILKRGKIECIFLDLKLPGMNGIELCKVIRKEDPIACIFAMTGYAKVFELFDCREAGFDDYFIKPLDLQVIKNTADGAFEKLERWLKRMEV